MSTTPVTLYADTAALQAEAAELARRLKALDPAERFYGECLGVLNECFAVDSDEFAVMVDSATRGAGDELIHVRLTGKLLELLTTLRTLVDIFEHGGLRG